MSSLAARCWRGRSRSRASASPTPSVPSTTRSGSRRTRQRTFRGRATIRAVVTQRFEQHHAAFRGARVRRGEDHFRRTHADCESDHEPAGGDRDVHGAAAAAEGPVTIEVTYNGILNDKLRGFYLSEANGRKYAVSQMEPPTRRRAFPSFDEPAFKATFDISLMVDRGDVAISNGRVVSDTPGPDPGKHTVTFSRTRRCPPTSWLCSSVISRVAKDRRTARPSASVRLPTSAS
jgi:aminopeptidase N